MPEQKAPHRSGMVFTLLLLVWIFAGSALITLLPLGNTKANDFGYVSACPFAPWSTLALLIVAGLIWAVRQYLMTLPD